MKTLRELRLKNGLSLKGLGAVIGVKESTVSLYEAGKREPAYQNLIRLADFFGVSTDFLLNHVPAAEKPPEGILRLPVLLCFRKNEEPLMEDVSGYIDVRTDVPETSLFALLVQDAAMEPLILKGDVVVALRCDTLQNGDTGIFFLDGRAVAREYRVYEDGVSLISQNASFSPRFFPGHPGAHDRAPIFGRVFEVRRTLPQREPK